MASTSPIRIDDELYEEAKMVAGLLSRSASQQVTHWARIGRQIEAAGDVSFRAVEEALAGHRSYDSLTVHEQAIVRAEWAERIEARRAALDLAAEFAGAGRPYVELDDGGRVVEHHSPSA